jgi:hypothetical protein
MTADVDAVRGCDRQPRQAHLPARRYSGAPWYQRIEQRPQDLHRLLLEAHSHRKKAISTGNPTPNIGRTRSTR